MKLEWSILAEEDLNRILDYIATDSLRAAISLDMEINTQIKRLEHFPESGRLGRIQGTRELVINRTPYIVAYCVKDKSICILRILHGAQQWPDDTVI